MAYDIYACFDEDFIQIDPQTTVLVPTGIASAFSNKYGLTLKERGSNAVKSMIVQAGVIDSGFRGEIFVAINNASYKTLYISNNDKAVLEHDKQYYANKDITDEEVLNDITIYPTNKGICQAKLELVPNVEVKETTYEELLQIPSERGMGMLGNSGK